MGPANAARPRWPNRPQRHTGFHYFSFDDDNLLQAAKTDPVGFVLGLPERVILDEIQRAPELFLAIKASVDKTANLAALFSRVQQTYYSCPNWLIRWLAG